LLFYRPPKQALKSTESSPNLDVDQVDFFSLRHAVASPLPSPGYSEERPHCFQLALASGDVHLLQCESDAALDEWVNIVNWWAARESRDPLPGAVGSGWFGFEREWCLDFISGASSNRDQGTFFDMEG
jgi:hypothetical protein